MKRFLTIREAAAYLRLSKSKLYEMVNDGEIPHFRLGGSSIRLDQTELDAWVESQRVEGEPEAPPTPPAQDSDAKQMGIKLW